MNQIVLPDTSLCAIVRDEKMNPAGGIQRFVDSIVPYVEQAVIADTGSIDGTREILEEMQARYSNLKVVDIPFNGYAGARNKSLTYVKTKRALVLDADELLTHQTPQNDWEILKEFVENNPATDYRFEFLAVERDRCHIQRNVHSLRLFDIKGKQFMGKVWEHLNNYYLPISIPWVRIKHFVPARKAVKLKDKNWYEQSEEFTPLTSIDKTLKSWKKIPPSKREGFSKWKEFNPRRNNYI